MDTNASYHGLGMHIPFVGYLFLPCLILRLDTGARRLFTCCRMRNVPGYIRCAYYS